MDQTQMKAHIIATTATIITILFFALAAIYPLIAIDIIIGALTMLLIVMFYYAIYDTVKRK